MSIIVMLIIGGIIGWIGAALTGRHEGILGSVAIGIVGSLIGGVLASLFNSSSHPYVSFSWAGVIWSIIGAVILSAILNTVQGRSHHRSI